MFLPEVVKLFFTIVDELSSKKSRAGAPRRINRKYILEKIIRVLRTGIQWKELNLSRASYNTVWYYFNKWTIAGVFEKFYFKLRESLDKKQKMRLMRYSSIDASYVKNVHGTDCVGRNPTDRGRKGTKVSIIADSLGLPLCFDFSPANKSDHHAVDKLLSAFEVHYPKKSKRFPIYLLSDKGYDSSRNRQLVKGRNLIPVIPFRKKKGGKTNKKLPKRIRKLLKKRYVVEAYFGWIDKFRRLILRYDQKITSYMGFTFLASAILFIKKGIYSSN